MGSDFVFHDLHKAIIHVQLLVAMHQRISGVVCDEVHGEGLQRHDIHHVLHQAARRLVIDLRHFEAVPMEVHGGLVAAGVAEQHTVSLTLFHHHGLDVGPRVSMDGPRIELRAIERTGIAEGENESVGWLRHRLVGRKLRIVPLGGSRIAPDWFADAVRILDHYTQTLRALSTDSGAEYPDARRVHLHDCVYAFG